MAVGFKALASADASTGSRQRKDFQAKIGKLEATVAQQQKGMDLLTAQLKEQAANIQKVSDRMEMSMPEPRTVAISQ